MPGMTSPVAAAGPPRRALLARFSSSAGLLAVAGLASGCGVRLEDDAPDLPFIPRRPKVGGETALIGLLTETRQLAALAAAVGSDPMAQVLAGLHSTQATVLHDRLRAAGVPPALLTPGPGTEPATPATVSTLRQTEASSVANAGRYAGVDPSFATFVLAMMAQRHAADLALTPPVPAATPAPSTPTTPSSPAEAATASPSPTPSASASPSSTGSAGAPTAARLGDAAITAVQGALYLVDVFRPHAVEPESSLLLRTSAALTSLLATAGVNGKNQPPVVLGVPHPSDLTSPTSQRSAMSDAMTRVIAGYAVDLPQLAKSGGNDAMVGTARVFGELVDWGRQWGVPLTPFPGLA